MTILSVSKIQSGSSLLAPLLTTLCFQCTVILNTYLFVDGCELHRETYSYRQAISMCVLAHRHVGVIPTFKLSIFSQIMS